MVSLDEPGVHSVHTDEAGHVHVQVDNARLADVMRVLASFEIISLVSQPPTLEELFLAEYDVSTPVRNAQMPAPADPEARL